MNVYHDGDSRLPAPTPYRDYLAWIAGRDQDSARAQRGASVCVGSPRRLSLPTPERREVCPSRSRFSLATSDAEALIELGRARALTVNTLVQGAWAAERSPKRQDSGTSCSGPRCPADLPNSRGWREWSGCSATRFRPASTSSRTGLCSISSSVCRTPNSTSWTSNTPSLAEIERIAGIGQLFDTLLVFENFPNSGAGQPASHTLRVEGFTNRGVTHYPMTLMAPPSTGLDLVLYHDPAVVSDATSGANGHTARGDPACGC